MHLALVHIESEGKMEIEEKNIIQRDREDETHTAENDVVFTNTISWVCNAEVQMATSEN